MTTNAFMVYRVLPDKFVKLAAIFYSCFYR